MKHIEAKVVQVRTDQGHRRVPTRSISCVSFVRARDNNVVFDDKEGRDAGASKALAGLGRVSLAFPKRIVQDDPELPHGAVSCASSVRSDERRCRFAWRKSKEQQEQQRRSSARRADDAGIRQDTSTWDDGRMCTWTLPPLGVGASMAVSSPPIKATAEQSTTADVGQPTPVTLQPRSTADIEEDGHPASAQEAVEKTSNAPMAEE